MIMYDVLILDPPPPTTMVTDDQGVPKTLGLPSKSDRKSLNFDW